MDLRTSPRSGHLRHPTEKLLGRMLSPLCGFDQMVGFVSRGAEDARFVVAGADLTGVHVLRNQPKPKQGFYHIGGSGVFLDEAVIRSLGETVERYSQFVSAIQHKADIVFATHDELSRNGEPVLDPAKLTFFSEAQLASPGFPFQAFAPDLPLGWIRARSLVDQSMHWVPAQLVLVGYTIDHERGEPWLLPAMTTGSAAHTSRRKALYNALLELIQIDSAIGHWHSAQPAIAVRSDRRTAALDALVQKQFGRLVKRPQFLWLKNPDLPGFSIACMLRDAPGVVPAISIGLGSDLRLVPAMYKALLEAIGVKQLAKIVLLDRDVQRRLHDQAGPRQDLFNLDENVAYYATPGNQRRIAEKFPVANPVDASDLPEDSERSLDEDLAMLVESFDSTGKELVHLDLTTEDIAALGFTALRVWSPDTLSLPLPSAPPQIHPRFEAYGGFHHADPHPYP